MQRSYRNVTVLLFTCLIQRSDGSRMNSLFLAVGCLGFFMKQHRDLASPDSFFLLCAASLFVVFSSFSPSTHQGGRAGDRDLN
jgi:hypothetical protein